MSGNLTKHQINSENSISDDESLSDDGVDAFTLSISKDGYVRISPIQFKSLALQHLISGLDDDLDSSADEGAGASSISGYTEWKTSTSPAISLGWDWHLKIDHGTANYVRSGHPRSNIMLIDEDQHHDLGPINTEAFLANVIDTMNWEITVKEYIKSRYS